MAKQWHLVASIQYRSNITIQTRSTYDTPITSRQIDMFEDLIKGDGQKVASVVVTNIFTTEDE